MGSLRFSYNINDSTLAGAAIKQYLANHPEPPLLAYVLLECALWLQDRRGVESESDKFVMMMAAVNMVNS